MKFRALYTLFVAVPGLASAIVTADYQSVQYDFNTGADNSFTDATGLFTTSTFLNAGALGDSYTILDSTYAHAPNSVAVSADPGITVGSVTDTGNLVNYAVTFNDPAVSSGYTTYSHAFDYTAQSPMARIVNGSNQSILDIHSGYTQRAQTGSVTEVFMTFTGDWSGVGTGNGQHQLGFVDPFLTVINDFTYDPITNKTTFYASNFNSFNGAFNEVDVQLFGATAAVPEPATMSVLAVAGIAALRRRKK